jgi:hypothetical protein
VHAGVAIERLAEVMTTGERADAFRG